MDKALGWDYVPEIDSWIDFRQESTIEISLRLSSQLFGLQNSDYICLNGKICAKKSRERKKSERIFPASQNSLPGRPGNNLFPAAGKHRPDSQEVFFASFHTSSIFTSMIANVSYCQCRQCSHYPSGPWRRSRTICRDLPLTPPRLHRFGLRCPSECSLNLVRTRQYLFFEMWVQHFFVSWEGQSLSM